MREYDFQNFEPEWRKTWEESGQHKCNDDDPRPKYYCLDMFPYPSGSGLHVGHWRGYVLSDVVSRYKTLKGFNVLHPMGWDAFGLPAENDAIRKKLHPRTNTTKNIDNIRRQLKEIGAMYDWSREIDTTDPEFYRWTQWIFVKMFKMGLAYKKDMPINWCTGCKTVLANEEVSNNACEICSSPVEKKNLNQWMLRITKYAERLLEDLNKLEWPEKVKIMQSNWIGKSEGADVVFTSVGAEDGVERDFTVFTTRPDTLYGATYVVFAPEHPMVADFCAKDKVDEIQKYIKTASEQAEADRTNLEKEKTGVFTGAYAVNPVNGAKIPIWIADYVLMGYGTGAIMAVPAHDERDFAFATKFNIPIIEVIHSDDALKNENGSLSEAYTGAGMLVNSSVYDGMEWEEAKKKITAVLQKEGRGKLAVNYKLRDWIFSRQRYWGEPIPIISCEKCGLVPVPEDQLPVCLPVVESYEPTGTGESPLAAITEWVETQCPECGGPGKRETDTMPQWAGSSWYFIRYPSPRYDKGVADEKLLKEWMPVDLYVGGIEHAILHLLYSRFFTKVLFDIGSIKFDEPFTRLFNQGMICRKGEKSGKNEKMSKSKGNVVSPDEIVNEYGTDSLRLYELFVGPPEQESEWSDRGIEGIYRFLKRAWKWVLETNDNYSEKDSEDITRQRHLLVKNCTQRLESFRFNTIISAMMEFINYVTDGKNSESSVSRETVEAFLVVISPLAPHFAEELWKEIGHKDTIFAHKWPEFNEELAASDMVEIVAQVNGKMRGRFEVVPGTSKDELEKMAKEFENVQKHIEGKKVVKIIVVPDKLVNIVVR